MRRAGRGRGEAGSGRGKLSLCWLANGLSDAGCDGWYEIAFRLGMRLRRGKRGGVPGAPPTLSARAVEGDAGRARGAKNGRFAALREFGGSSE